MMFSLLMPKNRERQILDIAILNCIPLCKEDWLDRVYRPLPRDFVQLCAENGSGGHLAAAWSAFSDEAAFISKKLEAFKSRCAQVHCKASAADIRNVAGQHRTLVIVAHWKGAKPLIGDIKDPAKILKRLSAVEGCTGNAGLEHPDPAMTLREARKFVSPQGEDDLHEAERHLRAAQRRNWLDESGGMQAGNRLELWREMVSAAEFSALFPEEFDGMLYMVSCNSHMLADRFSVDHPNAICIASRDTVWAGLSLAKLHAALEIVAASGVMLWKGLELAGDIIDTL